MDITSLSEAFNTEQATQMPAQPNQPATTQPTAAASPPAAPAVNYADTALTKDFASATTHTPYKGTPFVSSSSITPQETRAAPLSYTQMLGSKRKEMIRFSSCILIVTIGISIHWVLSQVVEEWIEMSDMTPVQRTAAMIAYPLVAFFALWNLRLMS